MIQAYCHSMFPRTNKKFDSRHKTLIESWSNVFCIFIKEDKKFFHQVYIIRVFVLVFPKEKKAFWRRKKTVENPLNINIVLNRMIKTFIGRAPNDDDFHREIYKKTTDFFCSFIFIPLYLVELIQKPNKTKYI